MRLDADIAVVGSGFAGSLLAMIGRRLGRSVVLLERGRHPRFAIGESSTPLANLLLEELAARYDLPEIAVLAKWGTWQRNRPELPVGLKRGFTFYAHHLDRPWTDDSTRVRQLLVGASPRDGVSDTHWYRPAFDHFLVRQAQALGAEYLDETTLDGATFSPSGAVLTGSRSGAPLTVRAELVLDATGPRGFLHRALGLEEAIFENLRDTQALYSHFEGVRRWDELHPQGDEPPYPVDDAAVHHVFDGGWIWVLRFDNGITSAGVAATAALARELNLAEGRAAWERLLARLPSVREVFVESRATERFFHMPRMPFRTSIAASDRWAMVPSAAGSIDPLLSTGFPLTLLGIERIGRILEEAWETQDLGRRLREYSAQTLSELDTTARLVGAMYTRLNDFTAFAAVAQLYFAAASFTEAQRRLGGTRAPGAFLLADHPQFGPRMREVLDAAVHGACAERLDALVREAIECVNVAGLADSSRRNWYPSNVGDLFASAAKLGATHDEISAMLVRCGLIEAPVLSR